jgi:hypothetical protein
MGSGPFDPTLSRRKGLGLAAQVFDGELNVGRNRVTLRSEGGLIAKQIFTPFVFYLDWYSDPPNR